MELKYDSKCEFVDKSRLKKSNVRTTNVVINDVTHQFSLKKYGGKEFDVILSSPRTNYYLQISDKKNFDGFTQPKKKSYSSLVNKLNSMTEPRQRIFNVSVGSLFSLFEDTFFKKKKYCEFEFLFEENLEQRNSYYSRWKKTFVKTNDRKRKKVVSENEILYLRIKISSQNESLGHLVNNFSYFFTFLSMPKINCIELPDEILLEIFKFLDTKLLLVNINVICDRFHRLIESEYLSKILFLRMFPDSPPTKPDPKLSWSKNMSLKFRNSICWKVYDPEGDEDEKELEKKLIKRIGGSPCHAILKEADMTQFTTNCFVSAQDSHEWVVRLKYKKKTGYRSGFEFDRIGITCNRAVEEFLGHEGGYGLNLGNGGIFHNDDCQATTRGGYEESYESEYGFGDTDEDYENRFRDYGLFTGKKDGDLVKMTLSKGKLSFEYGKKKHKCVCRVTEKNTLWTLSVDPNSDVEAEIVSFKKV